MIPVVVQVSFVFELYFRVPHDESPIIILARDSGSRFGRTEQYGCFEVPMGDRRGF